MLQERKKNGVRPSTADAANAAKRLTKSSKPTVLLPGDGVTVTQSAKALGRLLADSGIYLRGGLPVRIVTTDDGTQRLAEINDHDLSSLFEQPAELMRQTRSGEILPAICSPGLARQIRSCREFHKVVPEIRTLTQCPVTIERDGNLVVVQGYDENSGILAFGKPLVEMSLPNARNLLHGLLRDFRFRSDGDRARALAAIITPALVLGGWLGTHRAPMTMLEADRPGAGKGFFVRLVTAIYNDKAFPLVQPEGAGVGSIREGLGQALLEGFTFVNLDNLRGRINSTALESILTEKGYVCRVPYHRGVNLSTERLLVFGTSNGFQATADLNRRLSRVRILKQPSEYKFVQYKEGDLLDYVAAHQPECLGAAFTIIKEWHAAGKLRTHESRHSFRLWARACDWITTNLLAAGPLMAGPDDASAGDSWLASIAKAVEGAGKTGHELTTSDILAVLLNAGLEVPGLQAGERITDRTTKKALQALGRQLSRVLEGAEVVDLGPGIVRRHVRYDKKRRTRTTFYTFE